MIRLRLLGSVDLIGDDGVAIDAALRRSKVLAVLAYLAAARPRGFHRRDKVAALFWPELPTERARAALRITLTRIRDALGADVILARGSDTVALDPSRLWCDVVAVEEALQAGKLFDAAALYRGDFLDSVHVEGTAEELEQWIDLERTRLRSEIVEALTSQPDIEGMRRAVQIAPTDERVNRRLISLLIEAGDHPQALRVYDDLARRLERDLELSPSPETASLVAGLRDPARVREAVSATPRSRIEWKASNAEVVPFAQSHRRAIQLGGVAAVVVVALAGTPIVRHYNSSSTPRPTEPQLGWTTFSSSGGSSMPLARTGARMVLDSTNDGFLMFGGNVLGESASSSQLLNDVWRFRGMRAGELPEWTELHPDGVPPSPRQLFGLTYDAAYDRMILHGGGLGHASPCANDTWILDHATGMGARPRWYRVLLDGAAPPARGGMRLAYDPAHRRVIAFGGHDCFREYENDVWVLTFTDSSMHRGRWRKLVADSTAGAPVPRVADVTFYEPRTNRLFVHGGIPLGAAPLADMWYLEHANGDGAPSWHPVHCAGPAPALLNHAAAYDSLDDVWLINGGADSVRTETRDTWRVSGLRDDRPHCRWSRVVLREPLPNARLEHGAMFDPVSRALIIAGGEYQGTAYRDVHVLRGAVP